MPRPESPVDPDGGPVQRFAVALRELRRAAGSPGYRELARRAHYSVTTLAQAARGDSLPSLQVTLAYVQACGGDAAEWEARWHATAAEVDQDGEPGADGRAPYVGLAAYGPDDAEWFHGRDRLIAALTHRLARQRFVAVVGASGSGKTSLLRAGLAPAHGEHTMVITPGARPLEECAVRLGSRLGLAPGTLAAEFAEQPRNLGLAIRQLLADTDDAEFLLIVDQFEEVFTLCGDKPERDRFVNALLAAAHDPDSRTRVVVGLRADFYAHCAHHALLVAALEDAQVLVGPLTAEELTRAISQPAAHAGLMVEKSLVATVVSEAAARPGALPFVSHAMWETWRRRRGSGLFLAGYRAAGGVRGAVAQSADRVYGDLDDEQQRIARGILLRLTAFGSGVGADTGRRVARTEVGTEPPVTAVLDRLAAARLVTIAEDTVEIAHGALISGWPTLREWLAEDRKALHAGRRLTEAAGEWVRHERDEGYLYRGRVLDAWQDRDNSTLNAVENAFLDASFAARDRERAARRRRVRLTVAGFVATGLVVSLLVVLAVVRPDAAAEERDLAYSRQFAAHARSQLLADPELALLLAIEAAEVRPTGEAAAVLRQATVDSRAVATVPTGTGRALGVAYSHDGGRIAITGDDGAVRLWDEQRLGEPVVLRGHEGEVWSPVFSADGRFLATTGADATVRVWDLRDYREHAVLRGHAGMVMNLAFSADSTRLASAADDGVRLWDVTEERESQRFAEPGFGVAFSPDGRYLATTARAGGAALVRDLTGQRAPFLLSGPPGGQGRVVFTQDGQRLVGTDDDGNVRVWDVASARELAVLHGHDGRVLSLALGSDGRTVAAAGQDGTIRLITTDKDVNPLVLRGHRGEVLAVAFRPDGQRLASVGIDGTLRLWRVTPPGDATVFRDHGGPVWDAAFVPGQPRVVSASQDGTVRIWRTTGGTPLVLGGHQGDVLDVEVSSDGRRIASVGQDGVVRVWDMATGAVIHELAGVRSTVAFAAGGRVVTNCANGSACVWSATLTGAPTVLAGYADPSPAYQGGIRQVTVSRDGKRVAGSGGDGAVRIWRLDGRGEPIVLNGHSGPVYSVAFHPDGRRLVSGGHDGTVRIWDIDGGAPVVLRGHQGVVWSVAFSADGRSLVTAGNDGTLRVWSATGDPTVFRGYQASVQSVSFSRDGRTMLTTHDDGSVRLQRCEICGSTQQVLDLARTRASRQFTPDERRTFGVRD